MKWKTLAIVRQMPRKAARGAHANGFRIELGPRNLLRCHAPTCVLESFTYVDNVLEAPKHACRHIEVLYSGRSELPRSRGWVTSGRIPSIQYTVKLTEHGEKLFHWRWTAITLGGE